MHFVLIERITVHLRSALLPRAVRAEACARAVLCTDVHLILGHFAFVLGVRSEPHAEVGESSDPEDRQRSISYLLRINNRLGVDRKTYQLFNPRLSWKNH